MNKEDGFVLRRWEVSVGCYGRSEIIVATTRGKALADAWRNDAFSGYSFGEFLKIARATVSRYTPHRWGDQITVLGKPAFFVDANRQYVQFAYPGSDVVYNAHPYDVLPEEYRPEAYRSPPPPQGEPGPRGDEG